jgi:hypothetical protein
MNNIITIDFFALTDDLHGIKYVSWKEIDRVLQGEMKREFISSIMCKKPHKIGVQRGEMKNFLKKYYNLKD